MSEAIQAAGTNVAPVSLAEEHRSGVLNDGKEHNVLPPRPSSKGFVPSGVACGPRSSAASEGRLSAAEAPTSMRRTWALAYRHGLIVRPGRSVVAVPHAWSSCAWDTSVFSKSAPDRWATRKSTSLGGIGSFSPDPPGLRGRPPGSFNVSQRLNPAPSLPASADSENYSGWRPALSFAYG